MEFNIDSIGGELRVAFSSSRMRSHEWRISQLNKILELMEENQNLIVEALCRDIVGNNMERQSGGELVLTNQ